MQGARHLLYAVGMLVNTVDLYREMCVQQSSWREQARLFAVVESNLAHARTLMDFLFPVGAHTNRRKHRDILAADYCTEPWQPTAWDGLNDDRDRISREILHLSFDREPVIQGLLPHMLCDKICRVMLVFVNSADRLGGDTAYVLRELASKGRLLDGEGTARA
jgi:hypothetical protein